MKYYTSVTAFEHGKCTNPNLHCVVFVQKLSRLHGWLGVCVWGMTVCICISYLIHQTNNDIKKGKTLKQKALLHEMNATATQTNNNIV